MSKIHIDDDIKNVEVKRSAMRPATIIKSVIATIIMIVAIVALLIYCRTAYFHVDWNEKNSIIDIDGDGKSEELGLSNRAFSVCRDGSSLWSGDEDWKVEDYQCGDIDRDGEMELLLLVWKKGSYGQYKPFWVESDEKCYSQHIFIYKWKLDSPDAIWMSSKLNPGVDEWSLNNNGSINILTDDGEDTVWAWNSWGLERVS